MLLLLLKVGHQVPKTIVHSYQTALGHAPEDGTVLIVFVMWALFSSPVTYSAGVFKRKVGVLQFLLQLVM
jgi:hypothetical protein